MNILGRVDKLEQKLYRDDESEFKVYIYSDSDDDGGDICSKRRDDCPEYPCSNAASCWWNKKHPKAKIIMVKSEDDSE